LSSLHFSLLVFIQDSVIIPSSHAFTLTAFALPFALEAFALGAFALGAFPLGAFALGAPALGAFALAAFAGGGGSMAFNCTGGPTALGTGGLSASAFFDPAFDAADFAGTVELELTRLE
jgi:hypothetical protein